MKTVAVILLMGLSGCTLADRNALALTMCERSPNCHASGRPEIYGPPQVRALEHPVQPTATKPN